jgi:type VI secretion system protein ImpA
MRGLDLDDLLAEVSTETPCGENLEYEPEYQTLEQDSQPSTAPMVVSEDEETKRSDWADMAERAATLLGRSKDLRLAIILTRAQLNTHGIASLGAGLALICGLLEQYWDHVYPQLDADDGMDPTLRINVLSGLCDAPTFLDDIRRARLITSKALGTVTYRDVAIAEGKLAPSSGDNSGTLPDERINAIFLDCEADELETAAVSVHQALGHVRTIDDLLMQKLGTEQAPSFEGLENLIGRIDALMEKKVKERGLMPLDTKASSDTAVGAETVKSEPPPVSRNPDSMPVSGEVASREEVARMLDKICAYYSRYEPSSPVPLLLQRAKRLVSKDFIEILQDLTPDSVSQAQKICGTVKEEATG